jgi:hypothetical protein
MSHITETRMRPTLIIEPTELPEGFEITLCKKSRRGSRARNCKISAQHKSHKHRVSWEAAEAFAPGKTLEERVGTGEA